MMTKVKVTCKRAKFQPSWLKLSLKGISLGGTIFLVEKFFVRTSHLFPSANLWKKITPGKLFCTFLLLCNWVFGRRMAFML